MELILSEYFTTMSILTRQGSTCRVGPTTIVLLSRKTDATYEFAPVLPIPRAIMLSTETSLKNHERRNVQHSPAHSNEHGPAKFFSQRDVGEPTSNHTQSTTDVCR